MTAIMILYRTFKFNIKVCHRLPDFDAVQIALIQWGEQTNNDYAHILAIMIQEVQRAGVSIGTVIEAVTRDAHPFTDHGTASEKAVELMQAYL